MERDWATEKASELLRGWLGCEGDLRERIAAALRAEREKCNSIVLAAHEVWASIPSSYDANDPTVQRHAKALNNLGAALGGNDAARDAAGRGT